MPHQRPKPTGAPPLEAGVQLFVDLAYDDEGNLAGVLSSGAEAAGTRFRGWLELLVAIQRAARKLERPAGWLVR